MLENGAGRFYVASTDDVLRRLEQHNATGQSGRYTSKHGPWRLVWSEGHPSRASALRRESQIKRMKSARWIRKRLLGETGRLSR
ncbi:MAG: GIY-YIG nuclease family protein [Pirellulales bacterium]